MTAPAITLLTDFGHGDPFVGIVKGVILGLAPGVPVIDLTHEIAPQDVIAAGLAWRAAHGYFPDGTVHVAVVDPGVGGPRRILAARTPKAVFLAPDNGLVPLAVERGSIVELVAVTEERWFLPRPSRTFHGRDIFAPVAAHIATGTPLASLGPAVADPVEAALPAPRREPRRGGSTLRGEILVFDRFGNALTNIVLDAGEALRVRRVRFGRHAVPGLSERYGAVAPGALLAIVGSSGFVEICVREGSARDELGLERGHEVAVDVAEQAP